MVFEHCDPAAPMMPQRWHRYTLPDNVAPTMSSGHVSGQTIQDRNTACAYVTDTISGLTSSESESPGGQFIGCAQVFERIDSTHSTAT